MILPAARLVARGESAPLAVEDYEWSPDGKRLLLFTNSQKVWRENTRGDYWLIDLASGAPRKLGGRAAKPSTLMFAKFSPDGTRVAYVRENNLYVEDLASSRITPLTSDGSRTIINGTFDWVYEEELGLRDGFRWSPDGQRIAYWQLDASGVRDFLLINNTDSLYSYVKPVQYPKTGTTNSAGRVGVVSAAGGATRWMQVPGDPRNNYIARMDWAANSSEIVIQHLNRPQNVDDVLMADATTGAVHTVLSERDSAWLDVVDDVQVAGQGRALHVGERARRLAARVSRVARRQDGEADHAGRVRHPQPRESVRRERGARRGRACGAGCTTSRHRTTRRSSICTARGWTARARRSESRQRVSPGTHGYVVAPSGRYALHTASSFGVPPVTDLVRLPSHEVVRTLIDNAELKARLATIPRGPSEFFRVDGGSGYPLDGWMIKPPGFDSTRKYPVLFYVYGEPAAQTVLDQWDTRNYLWHLMLAQQGYVVVSVDNRGTPSPRGRDWRKAIYGGVGDPRLARSGGSRCSRSPVRPTSTRRVGVWGWSGGGSMTLNLMFRSPELYKVGMAVAPVPDERLYDTIYQERYMGLPQENAEGYRRGSPITFAEQLQGKLLIVHGSGDDNVHFQNTEAVVNALVAANKPFTMMEYPEPHALHLRGRGDDAASVRAADALSGTEPAGGTMNTRVRSALLVAPLSGLLAVVLSSGAAAQQPSSQPPSSAPLFTREEVMVPMRDGVHLQTVILTPTDHTGPLPILVTRTPYGVPSQAPTMMPPSLKELAADGYIFVIQNLRGRFKSEGTFHLFSAVDLADAKTPNETTDAYDTIDWLVKNVRNNNGSVGMYGVSYDGLTTALALLHPHPALKAMSEQASPVDQWMNDDNHRYGALRESYAFEYAVLEQADKNKNTHFDFDVYDAYSWYLALGPLANINSQHLHGKLPYWNDVMAHPDYDAFWKKEAWVSQLHSSTVPNLNVAGFWDQEDPWGPWQIFRHAAENDPDHKNFMVAGPWYHGEWQSPKGDSIGLIAFGGHETAREFRETIEAPFFRHYLHGSGDKPSWRATTFQSGANRWRTYDAWPPRAATPTNLYLHADGTLSFGAHAGWGELSRVRLRSGEPGAVPAASHLADLSRRRLAHVGSGRPAVRRRAAGRALVRERAARPRSHDHGRGVGRSVRVHIGYRRGLRRQADRRVPRGSAAERVGRQRSAATGPVRAIGERLPAPDRHGRCAAGGTTRATSTRSRWCRTRPWSGRSRCATAITSS